MDLLAIQGKAQSVKEALDRIQSKKNYWDTKTKPLLDDVLSELINTTLLDWKLEVTTNNSLKLSIKDEAKKEIAALFFALSYNGLVSVDMTYYTKQVNPDTESTHYNNILEAKPNDLTRSRIYDCIDHFLGIFLSDYIKEPVQNNLGGLFH